MTRLNQFLNGFIQIKSIIIDDKVQIHFSYQHTDSGSITCTWVNDNPLKIPNNIRSSIDC